MMNLKGTQPTRENEGRTATVLINKSKFLKPITTLKCVSKAYNFLHWSQKTTIILSPVVKT
jgi:hypothetical protein